MAKTASSAPINNDFLARSLAADSVGFHMCSRSPVCSQSLNMPTGYVIPPLTLARLRVPNQAAIFSLMTMPETNKSPMDLWKNFSLGTPTTPNTPYSSLNL